MHCKERKCLKLCFGLVFLVVGALWGEIPGASPEVRKSSPPEEDIGGVPYKREEVFEFTKEPTFRKVGKDKYEIHFEARGWCDVVVEIIDQNGKVVRHLACGVLGPNAPEPLKKNSKEQTLTWDGKNDLERYVDPPENFRARVCLGLTPAFDKLLLWHPKDIMREDMREEKIRGLCCDKEGVYLLYQGGGLHMIQAYDHNGNYNKTILPLAADKVRLEEFPPSKMPGQGKPSPGQPVGKGEGPPYTLILPNGKATIDGLGGYGCVGRPNAFCAIDGMVLGMEIKAAGKTEPGYLRIFRLRTDGAMLRGGLYKTVSPSSIGSAIGFTRQVPITQVCIAMDPEKGWIYISDVNSRSLGGDWGTEWRYGTLNRRDMASHAVYRTKGDFTGGVEVFKGEEEKPGEDNAHFRFPGGVACDSQGRVYVCDNGNNRVQVFEPDGKFVKSIPVKDPSQVAVHPTTGGIYILSDSWKEGYRKLTKKNSLEDLKTVAEKEFKGPPPSVYFTPFCLDIWAKESTLWLRGEKHLQLWADKGDQFELRCDFWEDLRNWKGRIKDETARSRVRGDVVTKGRGFGHMIADPTRPHLYLATWSGGGSWDRFTWGEHTPRINTETGEVEVGPGVCEIGYDGLAYVRRDKDNSIYRYNPETWKPVAFDYGQGEDGHVQYRFCSGWGNGIGISPWGDVLYHDKMPPIAGFAMTQGKLESMGHGTKGHFFSMLPGYMAAKEGYTYGGWHGGPPNAYISIEDYQTSPVYPGRLYGPTTSSAILLVDRSGQMKNNDVIQGVSYQVAGVRMDFAGNIYVGLPFPKLACGERLMGSSVAKFGPEGGRIIANGPASAGVSEALKDPPKRPADFTSKLRQIDKVWAEGMVWSFGGYYEMGEGGCICDSARFALDFHGRTFIPETHRQSVAVLDTNGNFILRLGKYGNADAQGPDICFGYLRWVAVTDRRLYVNDHPTNRRIMSIDLRYRKDVIIGWK